MATATITSKGQMTIPKDIRERLRLKTGDRLDVSTEGDRIVMAPASLGLDDLCSILPRPKRGATLAKIEVAIRERAAREMIGLDTNVSVRRRGVSRTPCFTE